MESNVGGWRDVRRWSKLQTVLDKLLPANLAQKTFGRTLPKKFSWTLAQKTLSWTLPKKLSAGLDSAQKLSAGIWPKKLQSPPVYKSSPIFKMPPTLPCVLEAGSNM